jgi:transcriptional regulator with GAF, ATPase, and Fis domain
MTLMTLSTRLAFTPPIPVSQQTDIRMALAQAGLELLSSAAGAPAAAQGFGVLVLADADADALHQLRSFCDTGAVLALATRTLDADRMWALLDAGAADVLLCPGSAVDAGMVAQQVCARLQRWQAVQRMAASKAVQGVLVGASAVWRALVQSVVEAAAFTDSAVLVTGATGTGKELIARLIHQLDGRYGKGELVTLDCTTIAPELSCSEFFGHERGAYTGAAQARDGAFALADGGVLFLDEVGELTPAHQAQLLRVIQEKKYKRIGSNAWQSTDFRLVCATNRDLEAEVAEGRFRADLFYRIAAWRCRTPPLDERIGDILPLAEFFLRQLTPRGEAPELDPAVADYLQTRAYPGNVRDLRQTVTRLWHRHAGPGPLTIGDVPPDERHCHCHCGQADAAVPDDAPKRDASESDATAGAAAWPDASFEDAIRHALALGVGLKEIGQGAADMAMQVALAQEGGNVQRAAQRLGVTDRALQMRRAALRRAAPSRET